MPRQKSRTVDPAPTAPHRSARAAGAPTLLPVADSEPRDWSELGRRVLAEALRRAKDELAERNAATPAPVVPRSTSEGGS